MGTYLTSRTLFATFSLMKWISTSICFVLEWKIGLSVKAFAPVLSHHRIGTDSILTPSSVNNDYSQITSVAAEESDLYSDSAELLATTFYFLELQ